MSISIGNSMNLGNTISMGNTVNVGNKVNIGNTININMGNKVDNGNAENNDNKISEGTAEKLATASTTMKNNSKKRLAVDVAQNQVERKTDDFVYLLRSTSTSPYYNESSSDYSEFDISV